MKSYGICFCLTLSLSLTASESMHVVANGTIVILCMVEQCTNVCVSVSTVCVHISHLLCHSSVDRHLDYFCILAIINNVATNIGCRYLFELFLCSADLYPVLGLLDHLAVLFLVFLRSLHTIFHSGPKRETRNQSLHFNQSSCSLASFAWNSKSPHLGFSFLNHWDYEQWNQPLCVSICQISNPWNMKMNSIYLKKFIISIIILQSF